ncbi:unnamed protein product [Mytilus edulis]|uniref:Uncharacterized protein n=1 Tax=Mytilus edulis TaxID=6550 RepID=A0A8S3PLI3_MYTED|nr:unnamed protein product [Mytilus edulis]
MFDYENLPRNSIPLHRVTSCNCAPNNYGHKLLNVCKRNNMYIANSRVGNDKGIGKKTCNDTSVIDYLLLSSNLFPVVKEFDIMEFDPLVSDVHCQLHVVIQAPVILYNSNDELSQFCSENMSKWRKEKCSEFLDNVKSDHDCQLEQLLLELDNLEVQQGIHQNEMNKVVERISNFFQSVATKTFGKYKPFKNRKPKSDNKPWFNKQCFDSRKKFHKARKRYSFIKNADNRKHMKNASKSYKIEISKANELYQRNIGNKLRQTKKSDKDIEAQIQLFREKLQKRGYVADEIDPLITTTMKRTRESTLRYITRKKGKSPPLCFITKCNPRVKQLGKTLRKHWHLISNDGTANQLFQKPPIIAYQKHKNLKEYLTSSKLK